jgi:FkbM family methyltransferase
MNIYRKIIFTCKLGFLGLLKKNMRSIHIAKKNFSTYITYRAHSKGDNGCLKQIFRDGDYNIEDMAQGKILIKYHNKMSKVSPSLIIDAGANIGASALFFAKTFSNSFIYTLEPEIKNFKILKSNLSGLNVFNFFGAIDYKSGFLELQDPGLSDWGFRTNVIKKNKVKHNLNKIRSISPSDILLLPACTKCNCLILKIDIEGGEDSLFKGDVNWMNKFPLIIIELHDWLLPFSGSSRNFIKSVSKFDFDFIYRGENIFLFNKTILNYDLN